MEFRFTEMSILPISLMIILNVLNLYAVTGLSEHHYHLTTNVKISSKSMKPKCDISGNPKCINPLEFSLDNNIDGWKRPYESANKKPGIDCVNKDRTLCVPKHEVFKNNKLVNPLEFNLEGNHDNLKNSHSLLDNNCIYCQNYIKRFINLFLRSSGLKNYKLYKGAKKQVTFEYIINSSELDILQKFVENGGNNFAAVNEVLERILFPSEGTTFYEDFFFFGYNSVMNKLSFINNSPEWLIIISVAVVGFSTYCIIFSSGGYYRPFINIIILILFAGYGFTWLRMYQEALAEKYQNEIMEENILSYCKGHLPWYSKMYYMIFGSGKECDEYYKKKFVDPFVKVAPTIVLSETMSQMVFHPVSHLAKAYGNFIMSATDSVAWFLKPLIIPICLVAPIFALFGILMLMLGTEIRISPFTGFRWIKIPSKKKRLKTYENKYIEEVTDFKKPKKIQKKIEKKYSSKNSLSSSEQKYELNKSHSDVKSISYESQHLESDDVSITTKKSASEASCHSYSSIEKVTKKRIEKFDQKEKDTIDPPHPDFNKIGKQINDNTPTNMQAKNSKNIAIQNWLKDNYLQ